MTPDVPMWQVIQSVLPALYLSLKLSLVTALILLWISMPLAWWLATTRSRVKPVIEALTALPLVLPPTVLGFYLLVLFSPEMPLGRAFITLTGDQLAFSFTGLLLASLIYSLPFSVQPLQAGFQQIRPDVLAAARCLGARPIDVFFTIALPQARRAALTGLVLSFAHTLGEFGVVLMVGGNIPGRTRVISIEVFSAVETLDFRSAHVLSAGLLVFSALVLIAVYSLAQRRDGPGMGTRGTGLGLSK